QIGIKLGTKKLYNTFTIGSNLGTQNKNKSIGAGLGTTMSLTKKLNLNPEISSTYIYTGQWKDYNNLYRAQLILQWQIDKNFGVFFGPAYNVFHSNQKIFEQNFPNPVPSFHHSINGTTIKGWIGWQ